MQGGTEPYQISFDSAHRLVVMVWKGYATSRQFREGTELMLSVMVQHQADRVLADIRDMVLIGLEDQKWLENNFLPRAITAGFRAVAIIKPVHYFNRVAVENISGSIDRKKLAVHFFDDAEAAKQWLKQQ